MGVDQAETTTVHRMQRALGSQTAVVRWLRLLAPLLLVGFVLAVWRAEPGPGLHGGALVVLAAAIAFPVGVLAGELTVGRPRGAAHVASVAVLVIGALALLWVQPRGPGAVCVLIAAVYVTRLLPRVTVIPFLISSLVVLELVTAITGQGFGGLAVLAIVAAFFGMLILAFRLGEANRNAARLLTELQESQAARAAAAGLAERQRLAREMHDVLAHSLSGMLLQLEAARLMSAGDAPDPRLTEVLERAQTLGRAGLDEARSAIGMLRGDELPGPERLSTLAADFQQDNGIGCSFVETGEPYELPSTARLAIYRVAQEALTNVSRHAAAERVEVRLEHGADQVAMTVQDFAGAPVPAVAGGSGYGLTGMRERAELLGGSLLTESTPDGFRVQIRLPR